MPKLAIQEDLLPGNSAAERIHHAVQLGLQGIEFRADNLDERLPEIAEALEGSEIAACGINMGHSDGCLAADMQKRQLAADALREALTCALDLEAEYVTFVPQCSESDLPDLTPYASVFKLQTELLIWLLRGFSDLADVMDCKLALLPVNHYETGFINRLEQAAWFRRQVDDHPKITIAASLYHMALEERDLLESLRAHGDDISVIYLADNNRRLPGQGLLPFAAIGETLRSVNYRGWLVLEGDSSARDSDLARRTLAELSDCIQCLRDTGLV